MSDKVSPDLVASTPEKVAGIACGLCGSRERMYRIEIWKMTVDGVDHIGQKTFCVDCETRPVGE